MVLRTQNYNRLNAAQTSVIVTRILKYMDIGTRIMKYMDIVWRIMKYMDIVPTSVARKGVSIWEIVSGTR